MMGHDIKKTSRLTIALFAGLGIAAIFPLVKILDTESNNRHYEASGLWSEVNTTAQFIDVKIDVDRMFSSKIKVHGSVPTEDALAELHRVMKRHYSEGSYIISVEAAP